MAADQTNQIQRKPKLNVQTETLLSQEAVGKAVDRRVLASAVAGDEFSSWQAGLVRQGDGWQNFHHLEETSPPTCWNEYVALRASSQDDALGHRHLAKWCERHELNQSARAHWAAVLDRQPNDLQVRTRLGYVFVAGQWFTAQECEKADAAKKELIAGLSRWSATCQKISKSLSSSDLETKKKALAKLRSIDDLSALPALEIACLQADESIIDPWIEAIAHFRSRQACLTLCRIALASPQSNRGQASIRHIKQYAPEFYVPELLSTLNTPIETQLRYGVNQNGELMLRRAMFRTTKDEKQVLELERLVRVNDPILNQPDLKIISTISSGWVRVSKPTPKDGGMIHFEQLKPTLVDEVAAGANAMEDQRILETELAEFNRRNESLNERAFATLEFTTGVSVERNPESWWQWWRDYNYRSQTAKRVNYRKESQIDSPVIAAYNITGLEIRAVSCLVAGTQVQTAYGLKNIESIQVGDIVVSQNVETGELGFKPVIRTTLRKPTTILRVETESGTIRTTAGHRWWVPGRSWVMSKRLEPNMLLHNATGTSKILRIVEEVEPQPTYNLVVEDYHTYFVGQDRVLSFDNIDPEPTLRAVPGYGQIVAQ